MTLRWLALTTIAIGCVSLVGANLAELPGIALITKLIASTGFIALAVSGAALQSRYGRWILTGLALSWAGDAFLELESQTYFLAGLVSFLLAHVCYTVAFAIQGVSLRAMMTTVIPVVLASGMATFWLLPYVDASMTAAVWAYVIVISVMVTFAWGARGAGGTWLIPIGATAFYLSDLSVAIGQFVKPDFPNYVWGLPLYYIAQTLLAQTILAQTTLVKSVVQTLNTSPPRKALN